MSHILDACALIAWLKNEDGADIVDGLLDKAETGEIDLFISVVNLVEINYGFISDVGADRAKEIMRTIKETAVKITGINDSIFQETSLFKAKYNLSLADAFGLGTAAAYGGTFVTCDHHELDKIEPALNVPFLWIRPKPQKA
jgi:predicted nucleic acid-binding protein